MLNCSEFCIFYIKNINGSLDRVIAIKYNGVEKFTFTYNVSGQLYSSTDLVNGKVYTYEYDSLDRLIRATEKTTSGTFVMATSNQFDSFGRASASSYTFANNDLLNYWIEYNNNSSLISQYHLPNDKTITYNYDAFDRLSSKALSNAYSISYTYKTGVDSSKTTALISELRINNEGSATDTYYNYTYDNVGNILTVSENGVQKQSYDYDALGQLTRENNVYANRTYVFKYNSAGNIYQKEEYSYTTGSLVGVPLLDAEAYFYQNSNWGDLLTNLNGTTITYDNIGNPNKWSNGYSLTWQGRNLSALSKNAIYEISCKYNSAGIRTHKDYTDLDIMYTTNYDYVLDGSKIIKETRSGGENTTLYYFYDESGVTGFNYNGSDYYYGKNLQGDITKIYDWFGNEVTSYTYDAWGKIISVTGSLASTVGQANPFRYRSYYYDTETGWYYLNSRYYDPSVGRFINADSVLPGVGNITGNNLFSYCFNNPVMLFDNNGQWPDGGKLLSGVISVAIGVAAVTAVVATGGAATPLLALGYAAVATAGTVSAVTGTMTTVESFTGTNPLRDAVGSDNYDFVQTASTYVASCGTSWICDTNPIFNKINIEPTTNSKAMVPYYPPNDGFIGPTQRIILDRGTILQRNGGTGGRFFAPAGTPPSTLSIPPLNLALPTNYYQVIKPIVVTSGTAAPWFNSSGGGYQYYSQKKLYEYLGKYLEEYGG